MWCRVVSPAWVSPGPVHLGDCCVVHQPTIWILGPSASLSAEHPRLAGEDAEAHEHVRVHHGARLQSEVSPDSCKVAVCRDVEILLGLQRALRTLLALVVPVLAAAGLVLTTSAPAHAEAGYRYWNYAHLQGEEWTFADTGPGDFTPEDGAVEGWRYGTSTVSQGIFPRADLAEVSFDTVCADAEAAEGEKRVAVLVDFGTEADAEGADVPDPVAECAVVPADANGSQVLESVVDVRQGDGMTCALDGYPAQGCGDPVDIELSRVDGCRISQWAALGPLLPGPVGVAPPS